MTAMMTRDDGMQLASIESYTMRCNAGTAKASSFDEDDRRPSQGATVGTSSVGAAHAQTRTSRLF